jgi:ketosteroid isomerase-like protein
MSDAHNALITEFYSAFQRLDAEAMAACYTEDVLFSDPAFGELRGRDAGDMWRMLTTRAKDFSLTFDHVRSDDTTGSAHWVATYLFSATGNTVVNDIGARFVFREARSASTTTTSTCGAGPARPWASKAWCWAGRRP